MDEIPSEHEEIHRLLINWGNWAKVSRGTNHCGSIEHKYRSPQCWYPPEPKSPEPIESKALEIEWAMRGLQTKLKKTLKFRYVYRAEWKWICQRIRLNYNQWEENIYEARQKVLDNLEKHAYKQSTIRNFRPTTS